MTGIVRWVENHPTEAMIIIIILGIIFKVFGLSPGTITGPYGGYE